MIIEKCAETIVSQRGITSPEDIDIEAIAYTLGAVVKRRPLKGCEARIIGNDNRAIITVNSESGAKRQRFSIGHELGHWQRHRGQNFDCLKKDIGNPKGMSMHVEREADSFSADLLMPWFLFTPLAKNSLHADFDTIFALSDRFNTSITSTAIRLIEGNIFPSVLVCHNKTKLQWFKRSKDIPKRWFPQKNLSNESSAIDIVCGKAKRDPRPQKVCASAWFDGREADKYEVLEQSIPFGEGRSLTLLEFIEDGMLEEEECAYELKELDDFSW